MEAEQSRKRRRYSRELKAQILAECEVPGASVAKVALAHGINSNILHGWRKLARSAEPAVVRQEFVPVAVAPSAQAGHRRGLRPLTNVACRVKVVRLDAHAEQIDDRHQVQPAFVGGPGGHRPGL
jgi:transposase-like protein